MLHLLRFVPLAAFLIPVVAGVASGQGDVEIVIEEGGETASEIPEKYSEQAGDSLPPLDKEPVLIRFVPAVYPPPLAGRGVTGAVLLELLVNERGGVDSVTVTKGLHPLLDSSVAAAAAEFTFEPAIAEGKPVPVIITYEYRVTLDAIMDSIQEYENLAGTVLERGTRLPVANAEVFVTLIDSSADSSLTVPFSKYLEKIGSFEGQRVEGMSVVTICDSTGRFRFKSLPTGPCSVSVPMAGYERFSERETIRKNERLEVVYRLHKMNYSDYEIVVYGREETREVARRTLSIGEVRKIPGFGGDAVKVVQALPGVARPSFGGGTIVVRGAPTWDSRFYLDGVPIPQLYHFGSVKSTYNSEALRSIDFYPGGFSSRYGNSIAGVIDLTGKEGNGERVRGFADVGLLDATAFLEAPIGKKVTVLATGRRSYIGDLLGFATEKFTNLDLPVTVAPFYYDYILRTDAKPNRDNRLFLTLFGSKDAFELIVPFLKSNGSREISELADRVRQMLLFSIGIAGWDMTLPNGWRNSLRVALAYREGFGSFFDFARFSSAAWETTVRDEVSYKVNERLELNAGVDLQWFRLTQKALFPAMDNTVFKLPENTAHFGLTGVWLDAEYRPLPRLAVIPGIRFDYYHELQYNGSVIPELWNYRGDRYRIGISGEPSFRLSSRFEVSKTHTIKAVLGTYNQTPQPQGFSTNEWIGNPRLPATRARHVVAGYEWKLTDLLFLDLQAYHNQQWGIPDFASNNDRIDDSNGPRLLPDGKGRMYGLELLLRHDKGERFFGWVAYTLSLSERYDRDERRYALYNRDQTHNLQLVGSCRLPREWEIGTRIRYVSGNPFTPVTGSVFDATNRFYYPINGKENSERNDPFFQLDLRVDRRFVFDRWMLAIYLDLQNLLVFLYASPEFTVYNYDYTEISTISFPFIPSFGFRAEF